MLSTFKEVNRIMTESPVFLDEVLVCLVSHQYTEVKRSETLVGGQKELEV